MDECLACLGDFSMRKRRERADGDTRNEAIVSGVGRFLFIAPFSIAHLLGRAGGIWLLFTFRQRLVFLPVLSYPYLRSLISFPFTRGVGVSCVAWGDTPWQVGGVIWLLVPRPVPSSRSAARSISPYRLAGGCSAPFLSAHFLRYSVAAAAGRIVFPRSLRSSPFVSFLVSLARLVWASRVYSLRLAHLSVSSRRFVSISAIRFASRVFVSLCGSSPSSRAIRLVKQPVFSRFAWRLVSAARRAGRALSVSRLILFCSRIISLVASHRHDDERRLVLPLPRGSVPLSRCPVVESDWAMTVGGNGRAVRRYGGTRRFCQLDFPIRAGDEMTMMIWIRPPQYEGNCERQRYGDR